MLGAVLIRKNIRWRFAEHFRPGDRNTSSYCYFQILLSISKTYSPKVVWFGFNSCDAAAD